MQQSDSVIHIYNMSFSYSFPLWFITGYWICYATVLCSRALLFIYSRYNSLYLLISILPSPNLSPHFGNSSVFYYRYKLLLNMIMVKWDLPLIVPIFNYIKLELSVFGPLFVGGDPWRLHSVLLWSFESLLWHFMCFGWWQRQY